MVPHRCRRRKGGVGGCPGGALLVFPAVEGGEQAGLFGVRHVHLGWRLASRRAGRLLRVDGRRVPHDGGRVEHDMGLGRHAAGGGEQKPGAQGGKERARGLREGGHRPV